MAPGRTRPVRLAWEPAPAAEVRPARLVRQVRVPGTGRGPQHGRLVEGDNLPVMAGLLAELEGRIDLIYVDPPFHTGKRLRARIGGSEDSRRPQTWRTAAAYQDDWPDLAAYLDMLQPRLELMRRLLSPTGTLYVHLDWRSAAYVRVLLDELFGPGRLLNEIVWAYHGPSPIRSAFSRKHDTLLAYTRSTSYTFNADAVRVPYDPATVKAFASSTKAGFGKVPNLGRGKVPEDWWVLPVVARLHRERTGYPTQKPLALLERIVLASSRPGDLVADFFCGSGTTLVAAARHGRSWLGCDEAPLAIAGAYRRLMLECPEARFDWLSAGSAPTASLLPFLDVTFDGKRVTARLKGRKRFDWLEADWSYDGRSFESRGRTARPWRSSAPLPPLTYRATGRAPGPIALRAADATGTVYSARLAVPAAKRGRAARR
jgi:DNA modification methylase